MTSTHQKHQTRTPKVYDDDDDDDHTYIILHMFEIILCYVYYVPTSIGRGHYEMRRRV